MDLARIDAIAQRLKANKLSRPLIEFGIMIDVQINLVTDMADMALYSYNILSGHTIDLNANYSDAELFVALAHELRHCEQFQCMDFQCFSEFSLKDAILLQRYLEADASTYACAVAYQEYKTTKNKEFLKAAEIEGEADIARSFIAMIGKNNQDLNDVHAYRAAFNQWFKCDERVSDYDARLKESYDGLKNSFMAMMRPKTKKRLSQKFLKPLGDIGPKLNYLHGGGAVLLNQKLSNI